MKRYYVASTLENAPQVTALNEELRKLGWSCTYDWTKHGTKGVQGRGNLVLQSTAIEEAEAVAKAHVVVVVLPGGRGTHTELGIAIALGRPIIIYSPDPERDFNNESSSNACCAFYRHPAVQAHLDVFSRLPAAMEILWDKFYEVKALTALKNDR